MFLCFYVANVSHVLFFIYGYICYLLCFYVCYVCYVSYISYVCICLVIPKGAARNPHDANEQEKLKRAAEDLRAATNAAASNALKKKLVLRLEVNQTCFLQ